MTLLTNSISIYSQILFVYFFGISLFYILLILLSTGKLMEFIKKINNDVTIISHYTKPISIVVPAYNEEETIIDNIISLLDLNYPEFEIIVVNDGSVDSTLATIIYYS